MERNEHRQNIVEELHENRHKAGVTFVLVFMFSLVVLHMIGLTPETIETVASGQRDHVPVVSAHESSRESVGAVQGTDVDPRRVVIESVGIDVRVVTPVSKDIAVLDAALLKGAVHYPGSGTLADVSNMLIFGHSSHLPVVNNQNFRAFNDLEDVEVGETVRVESGDMVSIYRVASVELHSADDALVTLSSAKKTLTLVTCNSFGKPTERYVVTATFVDSYKIARPTAYIDRS